MVNYKRLQYPHDWSEWEAETWTTAEDNELLKYTNHEMLNFAWDFIVQEVNRKKAPGAKNKTMKECQDRCVILNEDMGWAVAEEVMAYGTEENKKEKAAKQAWEKTNQRREAVAYGSGFHIEEESNDTEPLAMGESSRTSKKNKTVFPGKAPKVDLYDTKYYQGATTSKKSSLPSKIFPVNLNNMAYDGRPTGTADNLGYYQGATTSKKSSRSSKPAPVNLDYFDDQGLANSMKSLPTGKTVPVNPYGEGYYSKETAPADPKRHHMFQVNLQKPPKPVNLGNQESYQGTSNVSKCYLLRRTGQVNLDYLEYNQAPSTSEKSGSSSKASPGYSFDDPGDQQPSGRRSGSKKGEGSKKKR